MRKLIVTLAAAAALTGILSVGTPILAAETVNTPVANVTEAVADVQPAAAAAWRSTCSGKGKSANTGTATYASAQSAMSVCLSKLDANDSCWWGFTYIGYNGSYYKYQSITRVSDWWCGHGGQIDLQANPYF
jgi:hypothetical protein